MLLNYNKKTKQYPTWDDQTNAALEQITTAIRECPTLFFIDDQSPIHLRTDASDFGIGSYLFQARDGKGNPIRVISKAFEREQLRWHTPEKEANAIFHALKKFEYLLRDVKFTIRTDHKFFNISKQEHYGKVQR